MPTATATPLPAAPAAAVSRHDLAYAFARTVAGHARDPGEERGATDAVFYWVTAVPGRLEAVIRSGLLSREELAAIEALGTTQR